MPGFILLSMRAIFILTITLWLPGQRCTVWSPEKMYQEKKTAVFYVFTTQGHIALFIWMQAMLICKALLVQVATTLNCKQGSYYCFPLICSTKSRLLWGITAVSLSP